MIDNNKKGGDMDKTKVTKDVENKTLIIERVFDAPIDKLWQAYADKDWFEKWWGPEGWQTTTKEFDFSVGGKVHYCMKCIDRSQGEWYGKESWGLMEFVTLEAPRYMEMKDFFANPDGSVQNNMPVSRFSVEFVEEDGKTRLISKSISHSVEELEQLIAMGMVEGFSSQLNRLELLLANSPE